MIRYDYYIAGNVDEVIDFLNSDEHIVITPISVIKEPESNLYEVIYGYED